jgi:hypothetical protein
MTTHKTEVVHLSKLEPATLAAGAFKAGWRAACGLMADLQAEAGAPLSMVRATRELGEHAPEPTIAFAQTFGEWPDA